MTKPDELSLPRIAREPSIEPSPSPRRQKYRSRAYGMGCAIAANHAAVRRRVRPEPTSSVSNSRGPHQELSLAGRAHGRAFARVLCDVLDTQHGPKGHRENQPSQPRPRIRRREYGYKPLGDASAECRHAAPGRQRREPQCAGHPQYGEAADVSASKPFFWNCPGATSPSPRPEPKDYALNRIQFPPETPQHHDPTRPRRSRS
jgi:hypothetical protein